MEDGILLYRGSLIDSSLTCANSRGWVSSWIVYLQLEWMRSSCSIRDFLASLQYSHFSSNIIFRIILRKKRGFWYTRPISRATKSYELQRQYVERILEIERKLKILGAGRFRWKYNESHVSNTHCTLETILSFVRRLWIGACLRWKIRRLGKRKAAERLERLKNIGK